MSEHSPTSTRNTGALHFVGAVVSWIVLLGAVGILAATIVVPRVTGATPYTILTGSMAPTMPPGTLVVDRKVDFDSIEVGDVVTYQLVSGKDAVVTHRVIGFSVSGKGERTLITKGDANNTEDAIPVQAVQVRGVVWYHLPQIGRLNTAITGDQHLVMTAGVIGLLMLYAGSQFAGALLDRRRNRRTKAEAAAQENQREAVSV